MVDSKKIVEVLLFCSSEPLSESIYRHVIQDDDDEPLSSIVNRLNNEYLESSKGFTIMKISGGYQILSLAEYHIYIERLSAKPSKIQLTQAAIEALSIIVYSQPVSRLEIESIRGVDCGSVIRTLMEKGIVTVKGRGKSSGRPLLFGTTNQFLEYFGLNHVSELPKINEFSDLIDKNNNAELYINKNAIK